jgi:hypothetical protein
LVSEAVERGIFMSDFDCGNELAGVLYFPGGMIRQFNYECASFAKA